MLSHFVPADAPNVTEQHWIDGVRTTYKGDLVIGRDLLEIKL